jgi:integrase
MASISRDPNGRRRILFVDASGVRKAIRLGKVTQREAETIKIRVERLVSAAITSHSIDNETADWLNSIGDDLSEKLASAGLIPRRATTTLGSFIADYITSRVDLKPRTHVLLNEVRKGLVELFGPDRSLASITAGDADKFRLWLVSKGLAEATVRRRLGRAKQFFHAAIRNRLLRENPFADVKTTVRGNPERMYFINREDAQKVIDACPDHEWRLMFALSRFGGLRCPSEHLALTWADIDWERSRMLVRSPKTEHHEGHESRWVPIFPELRPFIDEAWERAVKGQEHVIARWRDTNVNLRTHLLRIIKRAGLTAWPRLFQNLRSSRETELAASYPIHIVCQWVGNSVTVASKHYLQVRDTDFTHAAQNPTGNTRVTVNLDTLSGEAAQNAAHLQLSPEDAAQNAAQQVAELTCTTSQPVLSGHEKRPEFRPFLHHAITCENQQCPGEGSNLHPITRTSS